MAVIHIRKDGTKVKNVAGVVIKEKDFKNLYTVIEAMEKKNGT